MKTLKRTLSMFLALVILLAFVPSALAAEVTKPITPVLPATATSLSDTEEPTSAQYAEAYGYKPDTNASNYIVGADVATASGVAGAKIYIDFDKELIYWGGASAGASVSVPDEKLPVFFSTDGTKWQTMKFTIETDKATAEANGAQKDFQKVLDKGATSLQFTTALGKDKQPQKKDSSDAANVIEAAPVYKWGLVNPRPKLSGFKVDYAPAALKAQNDASIQAGAFGFWLPVDSKGEQKYTQLQIAYTIDGKTPAGGDYGIIDDTTANNIGVPVLDYTDKPSKVSYIIRVAPTAKSAASKAKKLSASTATKAPTLKVDYKKGIIKLKADMIYGSVVPKTQTEVDGGSQGTWNETTNPYVLNTVHSFDAIITKPTAKGDTLTSTGLLVKDVPSGSTDSTPDGIIDETITDNIASAGKSVVFGSSIGVRTVNTTKKPASQVQPIWISEVSDIYEVDVSMTIKGNSIKLPKDYEAVEWANRDKADAKWKGSFKVEKNGKYAVRVKNSAKFDAKNNATTGNTQSGNLILDVALGKDAKGKSLITATTFLLNDGNVENKTASAASEYSFYAKSAADTNKTIKVTDNAFAEDAMKLDLAQIPTGSTYPGGGTIAAKYKTSGIKDIFVDDEWAAKTDVASAEDVTATQEILAYDEAWTVADGTVVVELIADASKDEDKVYCPTITYNITGSQVQEDVEVSGTIGTANDKKITFTITGGGKVYGTNWKEENVTISGITTGALTFDSTTDTAPTVTITTSTLAQNTPFTVTIKATAFLPGKVVKASDITVATAAS